MFQKLITYSIRHKLVVGVFTIALVIWGIVSLIHLPFDSTPDITDNQVQVITQAPSLGAQEVEQYVTTPVEMALANIPELKERRSISRSGLSVITLVFDDDADIYWARSQVSQMLTQVEKDLPKNVETEMGPIATGLGEIYHYTVRAEKGYEHKYSLTQLRTIQDWIVRKQLSGTPGVTEVSGWGGYVKQYEVAINTDKLNASNLTVSEVFDALEKNNANTGGSYIEENSNQYFIRGIGVVKSLEDVANIAVKTVNGTPIKPAPAQVSHENGARRIYVGFNVKGRDVQSTVKDIQSILDEKLKLPEGYYYNYGGEFQNLQSATQRLIIVVPVALIIILLLLYATVKNLRESLFVFSAIPLAAIGGVWALWLRGMPFSISAGVGFIALFGVAVLNGIVLIGQMNQIQKQAAAVPEENDASLAAVIQNRIIDSCMIRLRPVLMTALVASMGFLPMALSHGDGAEVQRPLATVVIGGLITSTLLTLLVLPAIYKMFTKK